MLNIITHGDIAELNLDRPPANALNHELLRKLLSSIDDALDDGADPGAPVHKKHVRRFYFAAETREIHKRHLLLGAFSAVSASLANCGIL